ncbi:unnamed protein product [Lactuca saligna]|uniref:Disease resistance protein RPS4B/Roq1-like leucine-rich repeats domain-containing protein n=1 Tax=Lactuca saligna TaxID=75948 RepID=A0AA35YET2_LACSI|nr:unnamed protein product [Lactuca saligna]
MKEGLFGEGFAIHKGGKVEVWRDALVEAANLSGWDTKAIDNGHEAECVKAIIKHIQGSLYHKYSTLEEKLIGIIPRVEKVNSLLRMELGEVHMIGIWGMGGSVLDVLVSNKGTEEIQSIVVEGFHSVESLNFTLAFKNMTNLRLLHLDTKGMHFIGPEYLPNSLQYLNWKKYTANPLPSSFGSGNLVGIHMYSSSLVELWKGVKHLHNLKFIDCQESKKLTKTPNFTGIPNLERLELSGCSSLVKVHESTGCLEKLKSLDLSNCYELKSCPSYIMMKSLETISLRHCNYLRKFPKIQGKMDRLSHIYLHHTTIEQLPDSILNITNLSVLSLLGCINLTSLPNTISMLQSLTYLDVRRCIKLATLPKDLGNIASLEHLLVSTVTQLPSSIINLKNLKTFSVVEPPSSIPHKKRIP